MINFKKEQVENIRQILFVGLFSFPMVPIKIINVLFFCFSILTLILYLKEKPKFIFSEFKFYGFFMLPFLPYIAELLLYHNNPVVQFEFEKKLLFFIAPIIFYLSFSLSSKIKIENATKISSFGSTSIIVDGEYIEYFDKDSLPLILEYLISKNVIFSFRYNMDDFNIDEYDEDYEIDSRDFEWYIVTLPTYNVVEGGDFDISFIHTLKLPLD